MINISGFLSFVEKYSKKHNCEIELSFSTNQNKDKYFYVDFNYIDKDECENCFLDCKIAEDEYHFDGINDYNVQVLQDLIDCMIVENYGELPRRIFINGYIYNDKFKSIKHLFNTYEHAKCSNGNKGE